MKIFFECDQSMSANCIDDKFKALLDRINLKVEVEEVWGGGKEAYFPRQEINISTIEDVVELASNFCYTQSVVLSSPNKDGTLDVTICRSKLKDLLERDEE